MMFIEAVIRVRNELNKARILFPEWPESRVEQSAIIIEEAGEVVKLALNLRPEDRHYPQSMTAWDDAMAEWQKELVQTAAMAIRALVDGAKP